MPDALLTVDNLVVEYASRRFRRPPARVIEDVSFTIARGETLALVGESGSGKTTIGKALLGLTPVVGGRIALAGADISALQGSARRALAADIQAVFQNPYGSLNPSLTVGRTLAEPLLIAGLAKTEVNARIAELLHRVGLPPDAASRYPAQFSGGQRQRIAIARAVARREADRLRRAHQRPGRHDTGGGPRTADRAAAGTGLQLPLHHPRSGRGEGIRDPDDRAGAWAHRGGRAEPRGMRQAAARVHAEAGGRRARP